MAAAARLPVKMMKSWISEESELYRSVADDIKAKAYASARAETIIQILMRRLGEVDLAIREKIRELADIDNLSFWYEESLGVVDAESARRLVETIRKASSGQTNP